MPLVSDFPSFAPAPLPSPACFPGVQAKYEDKRYQVDQFFKYCQKWGLKMIRIWGYNHNSPKAKGVYDDAEMKGGSDNLDPSTRCARDIYW